MNSELLDTSLLNRKLIMDGLELLGKIPENTISACFADFQYRSQLDKLKYGNEGERQSERVKLPQMSDEIIISFIKDIRRVLKPSSHLFLWVDKFSVAEGIHGGWVQEVNRFHEESSLILVDMICWDKEAFGMGSRSRRTNEYLLVYQKHPKTTKNWMDKSIRDTWREKISEPRNKKLHPHRKPHGLTTRLLLSTTLENDVILDPCAGSFMIYDICKENNRNFIGCDISGEYVEE